MPPNIIDILRLGFPGLAAYFLYLAYSLSKEIVNTPAGSPVDPQALAVLAEKRKAVSFYGILCFLGLVLSIGAEAAKIYIQPPTPMPGSITATAQGMFSDDELKKRPLEVQTWMASQPDTTFKSFTLTSKPKPVQLPSVGGVLSITVPSITQISPTNAP
jgi:hypothetical protein